MNWTFVRFEISYQKLLTSINDKNEFDKIYDEFNEKIDELKRNYI